MGTIISMVSVSRPSLRASGGNSISHSSKAAKRCISNAGIDPSEIGLLINTGIYRYRNTGEPSIASMVQKKMLDFNNPVSSYIRKAYDDNKTFSFDLNQGACGWLTAIQIIDGFIKTGDIRHGMVVTGDSEPFRGLSVNYLFYTAAAAIILSGSEAEAGFSNFKTYSYTGFIEELTCLTRFEKFRSRHGKRNVLYIGQKQSYLENCTECAVKSLNKYLNDTGLSLNEIDLIIPSQSPAGLVTGLRKRTGLGQKIVEIAYAGGRELHTAGPAFALKRSFEENYFSSSRIILFLAVGSGISVSLALYQNLT